MNVLFVVAEADPFVKTGGLGDVGGSLPLATHNAAAQVRVILPKYSRIPGVYLNQMRPAAQCSVKLAWRRIEYRIEVMEHKGVLFYFIDNGYYFNREKIYGYDDEGERFAFLDKAVLECLPHIGFRPDVIHCHDWHTALIPLMLKEDYGHDPYYFGMRTVLTIHNLAYQGRFSTALFEDVLGYGGHRAAWEKLEFYGGINYLKAGLMAADALTTVSPSYAREIQNAYFGEMLDGVLRHRQRQLQGILNGIDTDQYDPAHDPYLAAGDNGTFAGKGANKQNLQEILGLPVRADLPVLALVSRLVDQKGIDLLVHVLAEILEMDLQMVILGTGDKRYEDILNRFAYQYPDKIAVRLMFDEALAHKIYGGADMLLMPSLSEPCGLSQMIAMRYGVLPIVRETGGLKDTVQAWNQITGAGNGFSFANYNAHELLFTVQRAVKLFREDKAVWQGLMEHARRCDFSWKKSAQQYIELYQTITGRQTAGLL
jgi:glycogen/starch synthases, ADP-glucose type